jgi:hypothetical protein
VRAMMAPASATVDHPVQGQRRFRFAVHQHPVQRRAPTVGWQQ